MNCSPSLIKANQFIYIYIILEEFTEQLDIHKSKGMTDEQFTTAKDIRRRGKNKVGVVFFNISAMHFLLLSCTLYFSLTSTILYIRYFFCLYLFFILDLFFLQNAAQNCRKRANDRLTDLTEGNNNIYSIKSLHNQIKQTYKRKREKRRNARRSWKELGVSMMMNCAFIWKLKGGLKTDFT